MVSVKYERAAFTSKEAANYIGVAECTLRKWRTVLAQERGHAPPPHIKFGSSVRYLRTDLDEWLNAHRVDGIRKT